MDFISFHDPHYVANIFYYAPIIEKPVTGVKLYNVYGRYQYTPQQICHHIILFTTLVSRPLYEGHTLKNNKKKYEHYMDALAKIKIICPLLVKQQQSRHE